MEPGGEAGDSPPAPAARLFRATVQGGRDARATPRPRYSDRPGGRLGLLHGTGSADPPLPDIVAQSIEFHGGDLYEGLDDQDDHHVAVGQLPDRGGPGTAASSSMWSSIPAPTAGPRGRVRLTNDGVTERRDGEEIALDAEGERRARAFVDARVFFPLLPYTLKGGDVQFEERGLETWDGRELRRVKVTFTPGSSNDADDAYTFWFDPETGRVEQFGLRLRQRPPVPQGDRRSSGSAACSSPTRRTTPSTAARCRSTRSRRSMSPAACGCSRPS